MTEKGGFEMTLPPLSFRPKGEISFKSTGDFSLRFEMTKGGSFEMTKGGRFEMTEGGRFEMTLPPLSFRPKGEISLGQNQSPLSRIVDKLKKDVANQP